MTNHQTRFAAALAAVLACAAVAAFVADAMHPQAPLQAPATASTANPAQPDDMSLPAANIVFSGTAHAATDAVATF